MQQSNLKVLFQKLCFLPITVLIADLVFGVVPLLSQTNAISITPEHTRRVPVGRTVAYEHVLTNSAATTATFTLEALSTQGWPIALTIPSVPTGTVQLPLRVGAQMTAPFQLHLTVPITATGITEDTYITATSHLTPTLYFTARDTTIAVSAVYLPLMVKHYPPTPYTPVLDPIDNSDQDNAYTITWDPVPLAEIYILEEAPTARFAETRTVYQGTQTTWTVPSPGQTPGTYHYRLRATNDWGHSAWSALQTVTVPPLFVGLRLRWDGPGYIRYDAPFDVGHHRERTVEALVGEDIVRIHNYNWYDPNPYSWDASIWNTHYNPTTCEFLASTAPGDPDWKFSTPWVMPITWQPSRSQSFPIDGQPFIVTGPHLGYTAFGTQVEYWKMTNRESILYWDGGGSRKQYVHPGDLILHYDTGPSRLMLYRNIIRSVYEDGQYFGTIQYIRQLTAANAFPSANASPQHHTRKTLPYADSLEDHLKPH
jgi:hypothetical protein